MARRKPVNPNCPPEVHEALIVRRDRMVHRLEELAATDGKLMFELERMPSSDVVKEYRRLRRQSRMGFIELFLFIVVSFVISMLVMFIVASLVGI